MAIKAASVYKNLKQALKDLEDGDTKSAYESILLALPDIALEGIIETAKPRPFGPPVNDENRALIVEMARYVDSDQAEVPFDLPLIVDPENVFPAKPDMKLWHVTSQDKRHFLVFGKNLSNVSAYASHTLVLGDHVDIEEVEPKPYTNSIDFRVLPQDYTPMKLHLVSTKDDREDYLIWAKSESDALEYARNIMGIPIATGLKVREMTPGTQADRLNLVVNRKPQNGSEGERLMMHLYKLKHDKLQLWDIVWAETPFQAAKFAAAIGMEGATITNIDYDPLNPGISIAKGGW